MTPAQLQAIKDRRAAITIGQIERWRLAGELAVDIDALTAALEDAWALLDRVARDADGFEVGRMTGRAEALRCLDQSQSLSSEAWAATVAKRIHNLGPAVPLSHDELRRENEKLKELLKQIRRYPEAGESWPGLVQKIDDALKESQP